MAFMQKQAERMSAWQIETTDGTEIVPSDLVSNGPTTDELQTYLRGIPLRDAMPELVKGWFARLSAPGYMDCTDWSGPYETEQEALETLAEMYGDDD